MVDNIGEAHGESHICHSTSGEPTLSSIRADLVRILDDLRILKSPEPDHLWRKLAVRDIRQAIRWIDEAVLSSEEESARNRPR